MIEQLVNDVTPTTERLGSAEELGGVRRILEAGPSCRRQRKVYEETGDFREVVASLVGEVRARAIATKPCSVVADEPAGDLAFPYRPERVAAGYRPVLLSDQSCDER